MKRLDQFTLLRVWAMLTGLFLAGWYFGELSQGVVPPAHLSMLVTAIGGFELFHCVQDLLLRRRDGNRG